MNRVLESLLEQAGIDFGKSAGAIAHAVVFRNHGFLLPSATVNSQAPSVKLLLIDRGGCPRWVAQLLALEDLASQREFTLLTHIARDAECRASVPIMMTSGVDGIGLVLTEYSPRGTLYRRLPVLNSKEWQRWVEVVLDESAALMGRISASAVGDKLRRACNADSFGSVAEGDLSFLNKLEVQRDVLDTLQFHLQRTSSFLPSLQHGDLWPDNVVLTPSGPKLIDFAECGLVWTPLFDCFHMLKNGPRNATYRTEGNAATGYDVWLNVIAEVLLREMARNRLTRSDAIACFAFYTVRLAAYRSRLGSDDPYARAAICDVQRLGIRLAKVDPEDIERGWNVILTSC